MVKVGIDITDFLESSSYQGSLPQLLLYYPLQGFKSHPPSPTKDLIREIAEHLPCLRDISEEKTAIAEQLLFHYHSDHYFGETILEGSPQLLEAFCALMNESDFPHDRCYAFIYYLESFLSEKQSTHNFMPLFRTILRKIELNEYTSDSLRLQLGNILFSLLNKNPESRLKLIEELAHDFPPLFPLAALSLLRRYAQLKELGYDMAFVLLRFISPADLSDFTDLMAKEAGYQIIKGIKTAPSIVEEVTEKAAHLLESFKKSLLTNCESYIRFPFGEESKHALEATIKYLK